MSNTLVNFGLSLSGERRGNASEIARAKESSRLPAGQRVANIEKFFIGSGLGLTARHAVALRDAPVPQTPNMPLTPVAPMPMNVEIVPAVAAPNRAAMTAKVGNMVALEAIMEAEAKLDSDDNLAQDGLEYAAFNSQSQDDRAFAAASRQRGGNDGALAQERKQFDYIQNISQPEAV